MSTTTRDMSDEEIIAGAHRTGRLVLLNDGVVYDPENPRKAALERALSALFLTRDENALTTMRPMADVAADILSALREMPDRARELGVALTEATAPRSIREVLEELRRTAPGGLGTLHLGPGVEVPPGATSVTFEVEVPVGAPVEDTTITLTGGGWVDVRLPAHRAPEMDVTLLVREGYDLDDVASILEHHLIPSEARELARRVLDAVRGSR